jgi:type II secretory pathway component PulF
MRFQAEAGIPLVQALDGFVLESKGCPLALIITEVRQRVEGGQPLSVAMEAWPRVFPRELVQLIRVGEGCGSLPEAFGEGQRHLAWTEKLVSDVKQATLHPLLVMGSATLFLAVLLTQVVPRLMDLLVAARLPLPGPTRVLMALSSVARNHGVGIAVAILAPLVLGALLHRISPEFRRVSDRLRMRFPVVGPVLNLVVTTRFAHNLGLLYRGGVPLPAALDLVAGVAGGPWVDESIRSFKARVLAGETLSEAMGRVGLFPSLMVRLVACGERTGRLDEALSLSASHYQQLLAQRVKALTGALEPVLILALVAVVGFIAVAMILPILSLLQAVR